MSIEVDGIKLDQQKTDKVITDTFEVNDSATKAVRQEIPVGVSGQPIDRVPKNPQFTALLQAGTYTKNILGGRRCIRLVRLPLQGGREGDFHCSRVCTVVGADYLCPEHDAARFRPVQTDAPKRHLVFNSSQIELTEAEREVVWEKDGKKMTAPLLDGRDIGALRAARDAQAAPQESVKAPEAPNGGNRVEIGPRVAQKGVILSISLDELDGSDPIGAILAKAVDAMDSLPATSIREMKNVVRIQEKLQKWEWKPLEEPK